jgi:hypothetical protein
MSEEVDTIPRSCDVTSSVLSQTVMTDGIHPKLEILG